MSKDNQKSNTDDFYKNIENLEKHNYVDLDDDQDDDDFDINDSNKNESIDDIFDTDTDDLGEDEQDSDEQDSDEQDSDEQDSDEQDSDEQDSDEQDSDEQDSEDSNSIENLNPEDLTSNNKAQNKNKTKVEPYDLQRLNNITFDVTAEVGHMTLSLQQLLSMQVGDTFDFSGLPAKVKLITKGLCIGDGYLVEINGRVGIKITSLSENNGTAITN